MTPGAGLKPPIGSTWLCSQAQHAAQSLVDLVHECGRNSVGGSHQIILVQRDQRGDVGNGVPG